MVPLIGGRYTVAVIRNTPPVNPLSLEGQMRAIQNTAEYMVQNAGRMFRDVKRIMDGKQAYWPQTIKVAQ